MAKKTKNTPPQVSRGLSGDNKNKLESSGTPPPPPPPANTAADDKTLIEVKEKSEATIKIDVDKNG